MVKKKTLEEFIKESNEIHKGKFDYSKFIYVNSYTKGIILCDEHGEFLQSPSSHLRGSGCSNCKINNSSKSINQFIKESNEIHKGKFDYSKFIYVNSYTKGIILCDEHGEFLQSPNNHLQGKGCPKCYGNCKKSIDNFIKEANEIHKEKFNYSKFIYINDRTKGIIICNICLDEFLQNPNSHLSGNGCFKCSGKYKKTLNQFIKDANEIHKGKYDYSKFIYVNARIKGIIICNTCFEEFLQKPNDHLSGHGCPKCSGSKTSLILEEWFKKENINYVSEFKVQGINGNKAYFDYYLEKYNVFIELDGRQHFEQVRNWSDPLDQLSRDIYKMEKKTKIIRVLQEDIWNKKFNFETLKEALVSKEKLICLPSKEIYKNHLFPWKVYSMNDIKKDFNCLKNSLKEKMNSKSVLGNSCSDFFFQYIRL